MPASKIADICTDETKRSGFWLHTWEIVPGSDIRGGIRPLRCTQCDRESHGLVGEDGNIDRTWLSLLAAKGKTERALSDLYEAAKKAHHVAYDEDGEATERQARAYEQALTAYEQAVKSADEARTSLSAHVRQRGMPRAA
jgi:tetratricopeptide (TPR) repeat protein